MIEIRGLTKSYSRRSAPAVEDTTFTVEDGEVMGFVGLNGAGKTTTIKVGAGVLLPTRGTVAIDGIDIVSHKKQASARVGWVPEYPVFEPGSRPLPLLRYYGGFLERGSRTDDGKLREILASVGLGGSERKKLRSFSQGMKKRFGLAVAMVNSPRNYLLDEVLNGLDPEGILFVRNMVAGIKREGASVLLSSHILSEVQAISDRIAFIHRGKLIRILKPTELRTASPSVRVRIPGFEASAVPLLADLGTVNLQGDNVTISNLRVEPDRLNTVLLNRGFHVSEVTIVQPTLEEFFMKLVGQA